MFTFRAMNTDVQVEAPACDEEALATRVAATFARAERRFSRFRADSELSALNRAEGPTVVSEALFDVLVRARAYVAATDGLFEPCIGATLVALGYDRSFAPGALDRPRAALPVRPGCFGDVRLDPATRTVVRPESVQLDLGGLVKGHTVDAATAWLGGAGAIDAGGDAVLRGEAPDGGAWLVDVEDPTDARRTVATLAVCDAAVATSAPNRRGWRVGGVRVHHLVDPRTGAPSASDLLQATVIAPTAEQADVFAKVLFLLGARAARRFLARHPALGAVLVPRTGAPLLLGALDVREVARA